MECPHCRSSMIYEKFFASEGYFWGWWCLFCGEILDNIILENRTIRARALGKFKK
jgi:hypothetical protein